MNRRGFMAKVIACGAAMLLPWRDRSKCDFRLTLESGTACTPETGKSTLYYTPIPNRWVHIYDKGKWHVYQVKELSVSCTLSDGL